MVYRVFVRTWWRKGAGGQLVPGAGRKMTFRTGVQTAEEARRICAEWFAETYGEGEEGKAKYQRTMRRHLGRKAEFESV
jgi:hypothetical protein